MSHSRSFRRFTLPAAVLFTMGLVSVGHADPGDHLTCFRAKTTEAFDAASVDLAALLPGFDVSGCKVAKKAQVYCVPSTKTVTNLEGGTPVVVDGDTQVRQRLCYKIRCETSTPQTVDATDQFGTRTLEVGKPVTVCTPAVPGDGPTTTTTLAPCLDADGDSYGTDCLSGPDCDDGNALVNPGASETCNGVDDDCDASVDESDPLLGSTCMTGQPGICATGTTTCSAGALTCSATTSPGTETCDGLDDDCDGLVDESDPLAGSACATGMPGVCSAGTVNCTSGALVCSQTTTASAEVCDNSDNDCDGTVDEGLARSCYTGPAGTAGIGACRQGTQTCSAGFWGSSCPGEVIPVTEICGNGIDDDCDGSPDDGC